MTPRRVVVAPHTEHHRGPPLHLGEMRHHYRTATASTGTALAIKPIRNLGKKQFAFSRMKVRAEEIMQRVRR